jgi:hypothetical protein
MKTVSGTYQNGIVQLDRPLVASQSGKNTRRFSMRSPTHLASRSLIQRSFKAMKFKDHLDSRPAVQRLLRRVNNQKVQTIPKADLHEASIAPSADSSGWKQLTQLIQESQVSSGIGDLAHQHDHYLHGTPKRES